MRRMFACVLLSVVCTSVQTRPAVAAEQPLLQRAEQPSLLQMIAEWQYPGSTLTGAQASDGATIDARGQRTVPSIVCKAVLLTDAPVDAVLDYYKAKLSPPAEGDTTDTEGDSSAPSAAAGRSVVFSDDSDGRPFALHTVLINAGDTSTTLIISRDHDDGQTHIAWKQYRRFPQ